MTVKSLKSAVVVLVEPPTRENEGMGMISLGDAINGSFELLGAWFTWRNAVQLYRDKTIKGVYWPMWAFFSAWGIWNLWYYPSLGQILSFYAGSLLVCGNIAWTVMAIRLAWAQRSTKPVK